MSRPAGPMTLPKPPFVAATIAGVVGMLMACGLTISLIFQRTTDLMDFQYPVLLVAPISFLAAFHVTLHLGLRAVGLTTKQAAHGSPLARYAAGSAGGLLGWLAGGVGGSAVAFALILLTIDDAEIGAVILAPPVLGGLPGGAILGGVGYGVAVYLAFRSGHRAAHRAITPPAYAPTGL